MVIFETTFPDEHYFNSSIEYANNIPKMQFWTSIPKKIQSEFHIYYAVCGIPKFFCWIMWSEITNLN